MNLTKIINMTYIFLLLILLSSCNVLNMKKNEPDQFSTEDKISDINFSQAEEEKYSWFSHPLGGAIAGAVISVLAASPYLLIDGAICAGSSYLAAAGCSSLLRDLAFFSTAGGIVGATMGTVSAINSGKGDNTKYQTGEYDNIESSQNVLTDTDKSSAQFYQAGTVGNDYYLFFPGEEKLITFFRKITGLFSKEST